MAQSNLRWHHKFQLTQQDSYFSAYNTSINDLNLNVCSQYLNMLLTSYNQSIIY